jgi:UDP-D-galactose:(glucosyl)LPS alpha-1,3-D-galactosyltransferase
MESIVAAQSAGTPEMLMIVINHNMSEAGQRVIMKHADLLSFKVQLRAAPPPSSLYPQFRWDSNVTYTRLAIPEVIPDHRVVLYLDVDTIVLQDISELLYRPLGDAPFAAVPDPTKPLLRLGRAIPGWQELGLSGDRAYFNNGMMLMDVERCAGQGIFSEAARFLTEHRENVRYWDQDAMNWAASDNWVRLERKWNTFALSPLKSLGEYTHIAEEELPLGTLIAEEDTAAILHFAGPRKPWMKDYPESPLRDLYLRFSQTAERRAAAGVKRRVAS